MPFPFQQTVKVWCNDFSSAGRMMIVSAGSRVAVVNNVDLFGPAEVDIILRQQQQSMILRRAVAAMMISLGGHRSNYCFGRPRQRWSIIVSADNYFGGTAKDDLSGRLKQWFLWQDVATARVISDCFGQRLWKWISLGGLESMIVLVACFLNCTKPMPFTLQQ